MKKIFFLSIISVLLFFPSCEEIGPDINPTGGGGDGGDVQERIVLIEEFTGVKCKQCPEGSVVLEQLADLHGDQLIPVSIHSGFFSTPLSESTLDFRTSQGDVIEGALGGVSGFPAAAVNRKLFSGQSGKIIGRDVWPGLIIQELAEAPAVEVELSRDYDGNSRELNIDVDLNFVENISESLKISAMITEDNIVNAQKMPDDSINMDYNHKHVLRDMLTATLGDVYSGETTVGNSGSLSLSITLPAEWVASNCHAIVFVHSTVSGEVYQANSIGLQD